MIAAHERCLRQSLLAASNALLAARLNTGTSGNVSLRVVDGFLISPSGLAPGRCVPEDIVHVAADGRPRGARAPSSEWRFHLDLYAGRPEVGAIVHVHSPSASALSCHRRAIPAFHYTVARFGGSDVRCAAYAPFGSAELSAALQAALQDRSACLMANHGATVLGRDLDEALELATEFELLCDLYLRAVAAGEPVLLDEAEIGEVLERFRHYGQPSAASA
jgi:L-fuculose-phosphate aldolase